MDLDETLRALWEREWRHRPSGKCLLSQAEIAIASITAMENRTDLRPEDVKPGTISAITSRWYAAGLSPATISKRLSCLSKLGVSVQGHRPKGHPKPLKWWLTPEAKDKLFHALELGLVPGLEKPFGRRLMCYIEWTVLTGLRVEETLRLTTSSVFARADGAWYVNVPGTKTEGSQATLPLCSDASGLFYRHRPELLGLPDYRTLHAWWEHCRAFLGEQDNPTATLKALRRNAARHLHVTLGMPIDMVRQYLRHDDIETTMGYLKLTGGYSAEEMRRWVK